MNDYEKKILNHLGPQTSRAMARDIAKGLTGKGLSFEEAEALLSLAKDLLREAKI